jgi:hypothetical protein
MADTCRKVFTAEILETVFTKTFVKTELEGKRRAALFVAESAYNLDTQEIVFPFVHHYLKLVSRWSESRDKLLENELELKDLEKRTWEARHVYVKAGSKRGEAKNLTDALSNEFFAERARVGTERAQFKELCNNVNWVFRNFHICSFAQLRAIPCTIEAAGFNAGPMGVVREPQQQDAHVALAADEEEEAVPPRRCGPCVAEGCNGVYSASNGVCMVCELKHCIRCAKMSLDGHVCDPGDAATVRYLASSTRQCPRCHMSISRVQGCDQMMCTNCHCVFSWRTGAEERGVIHNPHFYQLGADLRQRVVDDRAARGVAPAGAVDRFVQGVGQRNACDEAVEHDPYCIEFTSPIFLRLLEQAMPTDAARRRVLEAHRRAVDYTAAVATAQRRRTSEELQTRAMRISFLRGAVLPEVVYITHGHPEGHTSLSYVLTNEVKPLKKEDYVKQLMRIDTERTKTRKLIEMQTTFAAAAEDALRLLLASSPDERKELMKRLGELMEETAAVVDTVRRGKKRKPAPRAQAAAAASETEDSEDD